MRTIKRWIKAWSILSSYKKYLPCRSHHGSNRRLLYRNLWGAIMWALEAEEKERERTHYIGGSRRG